MPRKIRIGGREYVVTDDMSASDIAAMMERLGHEPAPEEPADEDAVRPDYGLTKAEIKSDPSAFDTFLSSLLGEKELVETRKGDVSARRGGIPGQIAALAGGTANLPLVGPVLAKDAPPMSEASAIHEEEGHRKGKGALYDAKAWLTGAGTPEGLSPAYWRPSEVYAYTSQPSSLSRDEIRNVFGHAMKSNPALFDYVMKHRAPKSDWPTTIEGFTGEKKK